MISQASTAELSQLTKAIVDAPSNANLLRRRATLLSELGRHDQAKADYLAALALEPGDFSALNDLGVLLERTDYRSAARLAYGEAVRLHPDNPIGRINLGNALLADGQGDAAREQFEAALRLAPDHPDAHQGLANLLQSEGQAEAAEQHRQASYRGRAITRLPYRGAGAPCRVLLLVSAAGGNIPTRFVLNEDQFEVSVLVAEAFTPGAALPSHDVAFNAIGDADADPSGRALDAARAVLTHTGAPVVNPPALVRRTGRVDNAARLAALPGVAAPKTERVARKVLAEAAARFGYPLLLRSPGFHTGLHFARIEGPGDLAGAAQALPGVQLLLIQPLNAKDRDGWFRKYRAMAIGGRLFPMHLALSRDWKVHYFTADMADRPDHRTLEADFLADMAGFIGPKAMHALQAIADALGLDYAGIDFGVGEDGRLVLFEANATMVINPPEPGAIWDYRRGPIAAALMAAQAMVREKARLASVSAGGDL